MSPITNNDKQTSNHNNNNSNNHGNIFSMAREFVHGVVRTEERQEAEKPLGETVMDNVQEKVNDVVENVEEKFQERIDEGTVREQNHVETKSHVQDNKSLLEMAKEKALKAREDLYDATKSKEEKKRDQEMMDNHGIPEFAVPPTPGN